ncbi:hypothetical protein FVB32_03055 [Flagellimonas hymeniacidonis]|uniref:Uncharacterized protein n=1 Tax=Flagellimonas hymeniacidonis TaxID=2603628 RepID=A0A5C8V820_9FLAO|nr:hypothetical protein [Flagellimonas hymeniacidonis]TXN37279.1 hypothetical protein FVB32_03055 [Flagellimonas hymeniacidonis]
MKDNFLEKWILNLVKSEYEFGKIPKQATYRLRERMDDFIEVTIDWMDKENNHFKIVYHARSYGRRKINESTEMIDDSIFELENYYTLEIHSYVNHIKRSYSTRKIANYDVMNVVEQLENLDEIKNVNS